MVRGVGSDVIPDSGGAKINALSVREAEMRAFERAVALEPKHAWAHCNLGVTCLEVFLRDRRKTTSSPLRRPDSVCYFGILAMSDEEAEADDALREVPTLESICLGAIAQMVHAHHIRRLLGRRRATIVRKLFLQVAVGARTVHGYSISHADATARVR